MSKTKQQQQAEARNNSAVIDQDQTQEQDRQEQAPVAIQSEISEAIQTATSLRLPDGWTKIEKDELDDSSNGSFGALRDQVVIGYKLPVRFATSSVKVNGKAVKTPTDHLCLLVMANGSIHVRRTYFNDNGLMAMGKGATLSREQALALSYLISNV